MMKPAAKRPAAGPFVLIDSREQSPWVFTLPSVVVGLPTGDYSLAGLEHLVAVERKSLPDLVACVGRDRDRFKAELQRLAGYRFRLLVIEATAADIERGGWRGEMKPAQVLGSLASWSARWTIPIWLGGSPASCAAYVERWFVNVARIVMDENRAVHGLLARNEMSGDIGRLTTL